jgi:hypothetical protein
VSSMAQVSRGTPVMYFISLDRKKGPGNISAIGSLEKTLIVLGFQRNRDLRDKIGRDVSDFIIKGVAAAGRGKPSLAAVAFKTVMGFRN